MLSILSQFIFGSSSSLFGAGSTDKHGGSGSATWKDKSLCFDLRPTDLEIDDGEQLVAVFYPIEDIKGNAEELGLLKVTNLRLIWICCDKRRVNLSIGWRTVSMTFQQNLKDTMGMPIASLCVLTNYESTKYEFVFNKIPVGIDAVWKNPFYSRDHLHQLKLMAKKDKSLCLTHLSPMYSDEPFAVVFKVWQSYKQTHLFRHCRSNLTQLLSSDNGNRGQSIAQNKHIGEVNKLPGEDIIDTYRDVAQYESRNIHFNGVLVLTNLRLIWIDSNLPERNLSIPYIRIDKIRFKHIDRIIIQTFDYLATSNQVEFRPAISPRSSIPKPFMVQILNQIRDLHALYKSKPKFGPESCEEVQEFMSHLRPAEDFFDSLDPILPESLDVKMNNFYMVDLDKDLPMMGPFESALHSPNLVQVDEELPDGTEQELARSNAKSSRYLDGQPVERDRDLIYSRGKIHTQLCPSVSEPKPSQLTRFSSQSTFDSELGLAFERPVNNVELDHIWRIEVQ